MLEYSRVANFALAGDASSLIDRAYSRGIHCLPLFSDMALVSSELPLAEECLVRAADLPGLLLLYSSCGHAQGMEKLAELARMKGKLSKQSKLEHRLLLSFCSAHLNCLRLSRRRYRIYLLLSTREDGGLSAASAPRWACAGSSFLCAHIRAKPHV